MISLKRLWVWCKRIRYSSGFGVQSPTDFFLITSVIYEKSPYYAYRILKQERFNTLLPRYRTKVNKLLFRLINFYQPQSLIEIGRDNGEAFQYMCAASRKMKAYSIKSHEQASTLKQFHEILNEVQTIGCLHIGHTPYYKEIYQNALPYLDSNSWMIVGGIHATKNRKMWWEELKQDENVTITFDLYDIGLVFFDPKRYKENYIVNFL